MSNYGVSKDCPRQAEPSLDDSLYERIEMEFAIPVYVTQEQLRKAHELFNEICENPANKPIDGVHWASGYGAKMINLSQADAALLGKTIQPGAPPTGEPEWDEMTLHFESSVKKL